MDKPTFEALIKKGFITVTGLMGSDGHTIIPADEFDKYAKAYVTNIGVIEVTPDGEVIITNDELELEIILREVREIAAQVDEIMPIFETEVTAQDVEDMYNRE